jgi:hypothetical protein
MPLSENESKKRVEEANPGVKAVDCFAYESLYLVRVQHPSADEADYDPFFSVNPNTGEVKEFSVITDGDPVAIAKAFQARRNSNG